MGMNLPSRDKNTANVYLSLQENIIPKKRSSIISRRSTVLRKMFGQPNRSHLTPGTSFYITTPPTIRVLMRTTSLMSLKRGDEVSE